MPLDPHLQDTHTALRFGSFHEFGTGEAGKVRWAYLPSKNT